MAKKNPAGKKGKRGPKGPAKPLSDEKFEMVKAYISAYCNIPEICEFLGMSQSTLQLRFKERGLNFNQFFDERRSKTKVKVRKAMLDKIGSGDSTMMIWWSKNHLGMSDKSQIDNTSSDGSMTPKVKIYALPDNGRK